MVGVEEEEEEVVVVEVVVWGVCRLVISVQQQSHVILSTH